jgi:serine/threonine protein kinase
MTATQPPPRPEDGELHTFQGRTLAGRYRLEQWIGGGAFGGVFRSRQQILGRPVRRVACKVSRRTGMTEATARTLFADVLRLAEAMDQMTDAEARRHLVHVYDGGVAEDAGGRAFLAMEYVPGTTLEAQFRSLSRVPSPQLFTWVRQIARALHGLHTLPQPLLHRDLKPDNVLLGSDLTVRLIDFGLAAALLEAGYAPGVAGTVQYMAPETSYGEGVSVPGSDLYSLGVLIYEGLTGRHPFAELVPPTRLPEALHSEWLYQQKQRHTPVPPSAANNTVSRRIDALVLHCLRPDPAQRFAGAEEFLAALDAAESAEPGPEDLLHRARELGSAGELSAAARQLARLAGDETAPGAVRVAAHGELAAVRERQGDPAAAAGELQRAWELADGTAALRTRAERRELLGRLADAYRLAGNPLMASYYQRMRDREGRGG